jgi:hypothetical protein
MNPGIPPGSPSPIVTLYDVTDPRQASRRTVVRTLADAAGNRYVLLSTAAYLQLLQQKDR